MSNVMGDFEAGKDQESENLDQITAARHERAAACVAACLMFVACPHLPFRKADANIALEVGCCAVTHPTVYNFNFSAQVNQI